MKLIVRGTGRDKGKLVEIGTIDNLFSNWVVGIIFADAAEFNTYRWDICPYKSSLETIQIAHAQGKSNHTVKSVSIKDTSGFERLQSIDFGNSALSREYDSHWDELLDAFDKKPKMIIDECAFNSPTEKSRVIEELKQSGRYLSLSRHADLSGSNVMLDESASLVEDSFSVSGSFSNDDDDVFDSDSDSEADQQPVTVRVPLATPTNVGTSSFYASVLSNLNPASRAETSGEPEKVSALINSLKMSRNDALKSLTIHDADLLNADFSTLGLSALTMLDLSGCTISLPALKQLTEFSPKLKTVKADNLRLSSDSETSFNEFIKKFYWQGGCPQFVQSVNERPQPDSTKPIPAVHSSTSVSESQPPIPFADKIKVDMPQLMNAVLEIYKEHVTMLPFSRIEVITEPASNVAILMHGHDKLIQSTGCDVHAFSKLTNPQSGIDHRVQAQMILTGLGLTTLDVDDITADTELPEISDLKFGNKNNNPALTEAITGLLGELLEAREQQRSFSRKCF